MGKERKRLDGRRSCTSFTSCSLLAFAVKFLRDRSVQVIRRSRIERATHLRNPPMLPKVGAADERLDVVVNGQVWTIMLRVEECRRGAEVRRCCLWEEARVNIKREGQEKEKEGETHL